MTEQQAARMIMNLVEKLFDRSFAHGYSFQQFGEFVVGKLAPHNQPEVAAATSKPSWLQVRRSSYFCAMGLDTGTYGGLPHE
jgi:hypothetical protein